MFQLRKNVMDVSYHIVQYSNIITELREEIKRLRIKLDNQQSYGNKPSIQAVQCMCKLFPKKVNDSDSFNSEFKNYCFIDMIGLFQCGKPKRPEQYCDSSSSYYGRRYNSSSKFTVKTFL